MQIRRTIWLGKPFLVTAVGAAVAKMKGPDDPPREKALFNLGNAKTIEFDDHEYDGDRSHLQAGAVDHFSAKKMRIRGRENDG